MYDQQENVLSKLIKSFEGDFFQLGLLAASIILLNK